jgi:hypothetical protein
MLRRSGRGDQVEPDRFDRLARVVAGGALRPAQERVMSALRHAVAARR